MICREDELGMEAEVGFGNIGFLLSGPSHSLMMATQEGEVQIRCLTRKDVGQVTMGAHPPNSQPYPRNSCSSCSRGRGRWRGWPGRGESPTSWRWSENTFWLQILLLNSASTDTVLIKNWPHLLWRTYFLVVSISPQDNEFTHLGSKVSSPKDYMTVCFSEGNPPFFFWHHKFTLFEIFPLKISGVHTVFLMRFFELGEHFIQGGVTIFLNIFPYFEQVQFPL